MCGSFSALRGQTDDPVGALCSEVRAGRLSWATCTFDHVGRYQTGGRGTPLGVAAGGEAAWVAMLNSLPDRGLAFGFFHGASTPHGQPGPARTHHPLRGIIPGGLRAPQRAAHSLPSA